MCPDLERVRIRPGVAVAICLYFAACIGLVTLMLFAIGRVYGLNL